MPGERPVALKERPQVPTATLRRAENGGIHISANAVRETIALAQLPIEQQVVHALGGSEQPTTLGEISGVVLKAPSRNAEHFRQTGRSGSKTCDSPCRVC